MPYYAEGCRLLGVPDLTSVASDAFEGGRGFLIRTEELQPATFFWPRRPRRFVDLLRPAVAREERSFAAQVFANVTRITLARGQGAVESLHVRTLSGRGFTVSPTTVVLAGGGIENARLLLASGLAADGARDALGRYYMDHPKGDVGIVRVNPGARSFPHPAYWDGRPGRFRLGIRLSDARQARDELLDGYVRFRPILATDGRGGRAFHDLYRRRLKALRNPRILADIALGLPELVARARFKTTNRGNVVSAEIQSFLEQAPRRENRVLLSDRPDAFGQPLARLEWSIGELDRRTMRALHQTLDVELQRLGFGCVESPLLEGGDEPWPITRDASHHMGTTRMGTDPSTSVVDPNCRVHGIENLYVAGSSVFPASGYANPTLTIVALALRLGDHLASSVQPAFVSGA
jgi:choline dehydrogenase-like flavoprotein